MSAIFKTITVGWKGESYEVRPTMELLNDIEQTISLSRLTARISNGDVPVAHAATVLAKLLRHTKKVKPSDEEVYQTLMHSEAEDIQEMITALIEAVFPEAPGKDEAPSKQGAKSKK